MDYPIRVALILIVAQTVYSTAVNTEYDLNQRPFFASRSVNPETIRTDTRANRYVNKRELYHDYDGGFDDDNKYFPNIRTNENRFDALAAVQEFIDDLPPELKRDPNDGVHYLGDVYKPDYYLPNRYAENKPISLEYQPNRPFFAGKPKPYPEPIIRPQNTGTTQKPESVNTISGQPLYVGSSGSYPIPVNLNDRYGETTTRKQNYYPNPPVDLSYKPIKPFYASGRPYPEPIIRPDSSTQNLGDRLGQTTTTQRPYQSYPTSEPIDLSYKPRKPGFAPSKPYPQPIIRPDSAPEYLLETTNAINDRVKSTTTTQQPYQPNPTNNPIDLNYTPIKPFFAPSRPYPEPIIRPETTTQKLDERYGQTTKQTPDTYDEFLSNLQSLYNYVLELQKNTPPSGAQPETTTIDINKISEAIKPFLTTTTQRPAK